MARFTHIGIFLLCGLAISRPAGALTLSEAVHLAWSESPQLKAQEELKQLSERDVRRRLLPNEPQATMARGDDGASASFGLALTVGLPGKAVALRTLDRVKAESQSSELRAKRHELARTTAQAFLDCASQKAAAVLARAALQDQEDLAAALKQMYEAGRAGQPDEISAELQLSQARSDLVAVDDKVAVACRKLHDMIDAKNPGENEVYPLPDDVDQGLLAELGPATADELRGRATVQVSDATDTAATWSQLPDVTVSAARNHYLTPTASPAGAGKDWTTTYGLSVTLPILFGSYEEVEARRTRGQAALDRGAAELALVQARSDVDDAARDFVRSRKRLAELHAQDLPLAEALYESTFSAYKSGKLGYAELVLARRTLSDLKGQEIALKAEIVAARLRCLDRCMAGAPNQPPKS
jgi:outer membrane protein TolC